MKDQESRVLVEISKAEAALTRASDIHDMLDLRNASMAYALFTDAQGFREAAQKAKLFQLKAERKAGAWLAKHVEQGGHKSNSHVGSLIPDGVDRHESSHWQLEASVPEETFNTWADDCIAENKEITAAGLRRLAREIQREERNAEDVAAAKSLADKGDLWELHQMSLTEYHEHPGEVAAIITDPPYSEDFIDLYEALGSLAEHCLKPGGSLVAMVGHAALPQTLAALSEYLSYHWTLAYIMGGPHASMYQLKINNGWKPILWFTKGVYDGPTISDVVYAGKAEKDSFNWQQGEAGFAELVRAFTRPGDLVLDPMCGTGTTGIVAVVLGRRFVGIDVNPDRIATAKVKINERVNRKA